MHAVLIKFPFSTCPWVLPVIGDLYKVRIGRPVAGLPYLTTARIMCVLLRALPIRSPSRTFVFAGYADFSTHEDTQFCQRHRDRLTLVSKLRPDANLFDPHCLRTRAAGGHGSGTLGSRKPR